MKAKYKIGDVVFITLKGFILHTTVTCILSSKEGGSVSYGYTGQRDAEPMAWEHQVYETFEAAAADIPE